MKKRREPGYCTWKRLIRSSIFALLTLSAICGEAMSVLSAITLDSWAPYYQPSIAVLKPGTPIHWINPTASVHTIRHDDCVGERSCAFDSGPVKPNESYVLPGLPEGRYGYHCALHPVMRGVLVVLSADMPAKIEPNNVGSSLPSLD